MNTYTPNIAGFNPNPGQPLPALTISVPQDLVDDVAVSTVNTALEKLADAVAYYENNNVNPSTRDQLTAQAYDVANGGYWIVYKTADGIEWCFNCYYDTALGATPWTQPDGTKDSFRWRWDKVGVMVGDYKPAGVANWADSVPGWTAAGGVLAAVKLDAKNGNIDAANSLTTSGHVTATNNIGTVTGDVVSGGAVSATTSVSAGTKTESKRHYATGTAIVTGDVDIATSGAWGSTATKGVRGTDAACEITVHVAGVGIAANPYLTFTYHDGTWTTAPFVDVRLMDTDDNTAYGTPVTYQVTATTVTVFFWGTPVTGKYYTFAVRSSG